MTLALVKKPHAVTFRRKSANRKLAPLARVPYDHPRYKYRPVPVAPFACSTFTSIAATCSESCVFKRGGCYVAADQFMHRAMLALDAGAAGRTAREVIAEEVLTLDRAWKRRIPQDGARGGRDLRLHVGGDVPDAWSAALLAGAAERWAARGGGKVWTYTHGWRGIHRSAFGPISVLASVETARQVRAAQNRGYAPAFVVQQFPDDKRPFVFAETKFVPCPAETLGKTCVECRLCLDVDLYAKNLGIAFQLHGRDASLVQIRRPA